MTNYWVPPNLNNVISQTVVINNERGTRKFLSRLKTFNKNSINQDK